MTRTEAAEQSQYNPIAIVGGIGLIILICLMSYQLYGRFFPPHLNSYEIEVRYAQLKVEADEAYQLRSNVEYMCLRKAKETDAKAACLVEHSFAALKKAEYEADWALWHFERDYIE